jgi:two-component system OmpR family response regulator
MRIVIVEDNEMLAQGIANALRDLGHAVDCLADGGEGDAFLAGEGADVAIIDINLPGMDGFELVRRMRKRADATPILLLTARGDIDDRVTGLDIGADDYLVKPFDMAELAARVRALARRRPNLAPLEEKIGELTYHWSSGQLVGTNGLIDLPRRERALFECLLDGQGRIISKGRIAERLYGIGSDVEPNAVELLISRLRRKLADTGLSIHTARGLGYMLDENTR